MLLIFLDRVQRVCELEATAIAIEIPWTHKRKLTLLVAARASTVCLALSCSGDKSL